MSIEQILNGLESLAQLCHNQSITAKTKYAHDLWDDMDSVATEAIALLRTHPEVQPNEPLTLEELREMDGQPVWVEGLEGSWALVMVQRDGDVLLNCANGEIYVLDDGYDPTDDIDNQVVTAYRRPPKED